jgi:mono/diheme cytochrome c family protein
MFCLKSHRKEAAFALTRSFRWMAVGVVVSLAAGCGQGPPAEFSLRPETEDLLPKAEKAVEKALKENFGTPQAIQAWQRLPVNYGGVNGSVVEVLPNGKGISVAWDADTSHVTANSPLLWLTGVRAAGKPGSDSVAGFDGGKQLTWKGSAEPAPAAGDKFTVGFGETMKMGRVVYMRNCMHCHGVAGDGNGPTAKYLNPLPRDYRLGKFKFTSTLNPEKPTRDDLSRVVKYGIPGTYMPSFLWLGDQETVAVIEYVRWLSMRGDFEKRLDNELANDYSEKGIEEAARKAMAVFEAEKKAAAKGGEKPERPKTASQAKAAATEEFAKYEKDELPGIIDETGTTVAGAWTQSEAPESQVNPSVPRVADDHASRERGRKLYLSDKGKCYTCHGVQGRGDGTSTEDFWKIPGTEKYYEERGLHDDWGHILQPRNLTQGQYRGGRRPVDIFRRVYAGIKGTPMPAFGKTALKDEEIWDIVNYVMSLPYEKNAPKTTPAEHVAHK